MDIVAFIIGGFVGTAVGIGIICLCTIAKRADAERNDYER